MSDEEKAAAPADAPKAPTIVFDAAAQRVKIIPLQWPVTYDGKRYKAIGIRRMTQGDIASFIAKTEASRVSNPNAELRFPLFVDADGQPIPDALMDGLDVDDADALNEAGLDFLPRRFRPTSPEPVTAPSPGATTEPT